MRLKVLFLLDATAQTSGITNYAVRISLDAALRGRQRGVTMASGVDFICEHAESKSKKVRAYVFYQTVFLFRYIIFFNLPNGACTCTGE